MVVTCEAAEVCRHLAVEQRELFVTLARASIYAVVSLELLYIGWRARRRFPGGDA